ncbi:protein TALPID3-like isoform X2 [Elysia marginata]|uniref:Protein TALPID3-like isoform X2 n=1 Tax=Elysia marginata TaxID=1093978 RepID=A0AAV4GFM0_9GAST|nr:protein TALPID3-like isoform X2 [Elysia marginata]
MSLDLAELVSVTDNVVKSIEKSQPNTIERLAAFNFDSPFDSPRSSKSTCEAKKSHNHDADGGFVASSSAGLPGKMIDGICDTVGSLESKANGPRSRSCYWYNNNSKANKEQMLGSETLADESDEFSKTEQRNKNNVEQNDSVLDKSKDFSTVNQQETTTSDNNLGSSQGSRGSARNRNDTSLVNHSRDIHINMLIDKPHKFNKENITDSDPEIIDVPECIIAIRSGMSSASDGDSTLNEIDTVVEANLPQNKNYHFPKIKSFGKTINTQSVALKQGALSKGILDPLETAQHGDVYISQFGLTERQRGLKEALAKRADNSHPKKKVVQPKIISTQKQSVHDDTDLDSARSGGGQPRQLASADHAVTAAVAASAAVAATQPFLKAQQELEQRMQDFLNQLSELQGRESSSKAAKAPETSTRLEDLERQVAELNERRMEHMENLQQQQMQMQAQLLYMSRSRNHPRKPTIHATDTMANNFMNHQHPFQSAAEKADMYAAPPSSSKFFDTNSKVSTTFGKRSAPSGQTLFNPETLSSHFNYLNEVRELQGSHLDTPAPREKVPKPTPYSLPQPHSQKSLGFLEEILGQKDDLDKDTTFSVMGGHSPPTKLKKDR